MTFLIIYIALLRIVYIRTLFSSDSHSVLYISKAVTCHALSTYDIKVSQFCGTRDILSGLQYDMYLASIDVTCEILSSSEASSLNVHPISFRASSIAYQCVDYLYLINYSSGESLFQSLYVLCTIST